MAINGGMYDGREGERYTIRAEKGTGGAQCRDARRLNTLQGRKEGVRGVKDPYIAFGRPYEGIRAPEKGAGNNDLDRHGDRGVYEGVLGSVVQGSRDRHGFR